VRCRYVDAAIRAGSWQRAGIGERAHATRHLDGASRYRFSDRRRTLSPRRPAAVGEIAERFGLGAATHRPSRQQAAKPETAPHSQA
jgi:hypothetical protein